MKTKYLPKPASKPTTELVNRLFSTLSDKEVKDAIILMNKLMCAFTSNSNDENKDNIDFVVNFINKLNR